MPVSLIIVFTEGDMNNKQKKNWFKIIAFHINSKVNKNKLLHKMYVQVHVISHKIYQEQLYDTHVDSVFFTRRKGW